jgi:preprotein translocase subunit SecA
MYEKLAGMTGTAKTEEEEFLRIYSLEVVTIPTNRPVIRTDHPDLVFRTEEGKFRAVVEEIKEMRESGRPVLVGTTSIETSERLSELLKRQGIPHEVLNAKQHEREAAIVAQAGQAPNGLGNVTIATNMAGRGTDIVLGPGVKEVGGLHIIGTERHESRRIDNQLRGRSGRQGDPGSSRFFVSLEDELMRRFGSERIASVMDRLGMTDDAPIEHNLISRSIESAQEKVEGHNFDLRRHVVQYDDVMNRHREVIYADRRKIVAGDDMHERIEDLVREEIEQIVHRHTPEARGAETDLDGIVEDYSALIPNREIRPADLEGLNPDQIIERLEQDADEAYATVEARFPDDLMRKVERQTMLSVIDRLWVEHLTAMDEIREGVGLQAYAQRDPLVVYKTEGFKAFNQLLADIRHDVVRTIYRVQPAVAQQPVRTRLTDASVQTNRVAEENGKTPVRKNKKIGPNQPCWCGSGKKYKYCHGAPTAAATRS